MAKKQFKIRARLSFSGEVSVRENSRKDAEAFVQREISARLGEVAVMSDGSASVTAYSFAPKGEMVINRREDKADETKL